MNIDSLKRELLAKYKTEGDIDLYQYLIVQAVSRIDKIEKGEKNITMPYLDFLACYDQFIILYRREGDDTYLNIAKIFRRAAHKIYRVMLKKNLTPKNKKFLNLI